MARPRYIYDTKSYEQGLSRIELDETHSVDVTHSGTLWPNRVSLVKIVSFQRTEPPYQDEVTLNHLQVCYHSKSIATSFGSIEEFAAPGKIGYTINGLIVSRAY